MARKKVSPVQMYAEQTTGVRLSSHEKVCAERMKTLFKSMDEVKKEIKELRADMNKGKGAVNVLVFMAGLIAAIVGFFKWNG